MKRKGILVVGGLVLFALGAGVMTGQDGKTGGPDRDGDRRAIDALRRKFVEAYVNRDAAGIAASWTADGEFVRNDGEPIRGAAEIRKGYASFFKTIPGKPNLEIQADGLRFPSADTAVSEVTLRLKNEAGEIVASSWRNTLLVREGGGWKVALVREWDRDVGWDVGLNELGWLVGTWEAVNKGRGMTATYEWDENKVFLRGKFTVRDGAKVIESGTHRIGKDNAEGTIRSWVFQGDGGFGGGVWARDGHKWTVDFYGVTPAGKQLTATNVYVRVDPNTFTWQSVGQAVDGAPLADSPPVKMTRQKPG